MNWQQLKKNVGHRVQLRPIAGRLDESGRRLRSLDDDWTIRAFPNDCVEVYNVRTGHFIRLGKDHVHHFASNPDRADGELRFGFLILTVQVFLQGAKAWVEPNTGPGKPADLPEDRQRSLSEQLRLNDDRFERVCREYWARGTPKAIIDSFADLNIDEKADLYDRAVMWKKGRPSSSNPFRNQSR